MAKKSGKTAVKKRAAHKTPAKKALALPAPKPPARLPDAWQLTRTAALTLWQHKELFGGIALVYGLLSLLLVQGLANSSDVGSLKSNLHQVFNGHLGSLGASLSSFGTLIGSAGNSSSQSGTGYQPFLALIGSLAIIWALRQVSAGKRLGVRDAYYQGMYPLVPFILVVLVIGVQLLPSIVGALLLAIVTANGIAIHFIEQLIWTLLFAGLVLWSLYMLSSSLFALYIVTLPDMTPRQALRSARQLVRGRRWLVLRKILFLPLVLVVAAAVVMLPFVVWLTPLAAWIFLLLGVLLLPAVHTYMYTLYRELLND